MSGYTPQQVQAAILRLLAQQYATRGDVARDAGIAASGASGAQGAVTLVYQPDGIAGGNSYTDWPSLYAALPPVDFHGNRSPSIVQVDDTYINTDGSHPALVPAGAYNLTNVDFQGTSNWATNTGTSYLQLSDGVTITGATQGGTISVSKGLTLQSEATATVIQVGATQQWTIFVAPDSQLMTLAAGLLVGVTTGGFITCSVQGVLGDGTHTVIHGTGAEVFVQAYAHGYVAAAAVSGDGANVYWDNNAPGAQGVGPVNVVNVQSFVSTQPMSPAQGNLQDAVNQLYRDSVVAVKAAPQSVTSSTVLANVTGFVVPMLATDTWEVRARLYIATASDTGITLAVTVPTGATLLWTAMGMGTAAGGLSVASFTVEGTGGTGSAVLDGTGTGTAGVVDFVATVIGDNTHAGNIQLQFTQTGSSATPTTIEAGSSMRASRVE